MSIPASERARFEEMGIPARDVERLEKLKALVDRGSTEGERQAARAAMDRILAKYGWRRRSKQKPKPRPDDHQQPFPPCAEEMTFEEMVRCWQQANIDINESLANMFAAFEHLESVIKSVNDQADCGKL